MLWAGNHFDERSCCDLDSQGSDPNVARDTSSQYDNHSYEIVVKFDFKSQRYGPTTILLQGHALKKNKECCPICIPYTSCGQLQNKPWRE